MNRLAVITAIAGSLGVFGAAAAHADTGDWIFNPDGVAELVQSPARSQLAWEVAGTFHNQVTGEDITGDLFMRPTGGALMEPDYQFDTPGYGPDGDIDSAMYAYGSPSGSGYFVGANFFSPQGVNSLDFHGAAGQFLTGGDGIHVDQNLAWLLGPANYTNAITGQDALDKVDFANQGVLNFGTDDPTDSLTGAWSVGDTGTATSALYNNVPIWEWDNASFTGPDDQTITGDIYMNTVGLSGYDQEFLANNGDLYDVKQFGFGFTNLYYDPTDGSAVDILKTPFGDMNMSWASWMFTPADYADSTSGTDALASILHDNVDTLSNTIQFGEDTLAATVDSASAAADIAGNLDVPLG